MLIRLHEPEQEYVRRQWLSKELRLVSAHTNAYPNLGNHGTSRNESSHRPVKEWLEPRYGLDRAVEFLMENVKTMLRKIVEKENASRVGMPTVIDTYGFSELTMEVTRYAITMLIPEWAAAKEIAKQSTF